MVTGKGSIKLDGGFDSVKGKSGMAREKVTLKSTPNKRDALNPVNSAAFREIYEVSTARLIASFESLAKRRCNDLARGYAMRAARFGREKANRSYQTLASVLWNSTIKRSSPHSPCSVKVP